MFPRKLIEVFPDEELARVVESELEYEGVTLTEGINSLIEIEDLQKIRYLFLLRPLSTVPSSSLDERTNQFKISANEKTEEEVYTDFWQEIIEKTYRPQERIVNFEGLQYLTRLTRLESHYHDFYDFSYLQVLDEEDSTFDIIVTDSPTESKILKNLSILENVNLKSCGLLFYEYEEENFGDKSLVTIATNEQVEIRESLSILTIINVNITHFRHFRFANDILTQNVSYFDCAIVDLRARQSEEDCFSLVHRDATVGVKLRLPFINFVTDDNQTIPLLILGEKEYYVWNSEENEITFLETGNYEIHFGSLINPRDPRITVRFNVVEA